MEKTILAIGVLLLLGATMYMSAPQADENNEMVDLYQRWKLKYNKKYANHDQEWFRFRVFMENFAIVKAHYESEEEQTYTLELNQFADITSEEFAQTHLNLQVPKNHKVRQVNEKYTTLNASDFSGSCNAVRNQGSCGSCWAFSAVGVIECNSQIERGQKISISEQDLVDCSTEYGNAGCNGGWMDSAFEYIRDNGVATQSDYPYTAKDGKCNEDIAREFHVAGFHDVADCAELASEGANRTVSVAVDASKWSLYASGVFKNCAKNLNHGVVLVGVDDSGNWKIRNSWAASWGESGHMRLASGDTCGICQAASYPLFN